MSGRLRTMARKETIYETNEASTFRQDELRCRAEAVAAEKLAQAEVNVEQMSADAAGKLLHELQVYQIELQMQNDELRRSQQSLEASRAIYFELYNLAPVGYLTISDQGLISEANLTFAVLLDTPLKTLIKQPFSQFVFREDQDGYYFWSKRLFETGEPQECELRMVNRNDMPFWIRLVANLSQENDGSTVVRAVVSDISAPKRIEVDLAAANLKIEEASKAKSKFLANMSHELRTPLNTIIGFSEVLQDKLFGPLNEKQETFATNILHSGRHLLSLINDILDISKVEACKMELEFNRINLEELCRGSLAAFSEKARKSGIELRYTIDSSMEGVTVVADGRKIKQILYNLIDNGIKFNRPQGSVCITVQRVDRKSISPAVQIMVEDTGIGIAEEDQEKLFLPFSQLTQSYYDRQTEGTGLGLALTKQLVELHGGTIYLRSKPEKGCRFIVLLPLHHSETV